MDIMKNKIEGIIYKVQAYKENSRLLQVYTKRGKIAVMARGSQKINNSTRILAQYMTHISFLDNPNKSFINLAEAKIINDFENIKQDFNKTKLASSMLEIINKVYIDDIYHEKVFNLLVTSLNYTDIYVSSLSFALKMLYFLGYGINLEGNGKEIIGLNIEKGGIVYYDEKVNIDLNIEETIILLKITLSKINNLEQYPKKSLDIIKDFIYKYYLNKLEIKIRAFE